MLQTATFITTFRAWPGLFTINWAACAIFRKPDTASPSCKVTKERWVVSTGFFQTSFSESYSGRLYQVVSGDPHHLLTSFQHQVNIDEFPCPLLQWFRKDSPSCKIEIWQRYPDQQQITAIFNLRPDPCVEDKPTQPGYWHVDEPGIHTFSKEPTIMADSLCLVFGDGSDRVQVFLGINTQRIIGISSRSYSQLVAVFKMRNCSKDSTFSIGVRASPTTALKIVS